MTSRLEHLFKFTKQNDIDALQKNKLTFDDLYKEDLAQRTLFSYAQKNQAILNLFYQQAEKFFTQKNEPDLKKRDRNGYGLLHWAVMCFQNKDTLNALYAQGADINGNNPPFYITPAYQATQDNNQSALKFLLDKGADIHLRTSRGATPLHSAAETGHHDIIKLLLDSGARTSERCSNGITPIFIAAQNGHDQAIELLVDAGADVNQRCANNATPLFAAIQNGHTQAVQRLINAKANVHTYVNNDISMLDVARRFNHTEIILLLEAVEKKGNHLPPG